MINRSDDKIEEITGSVESKEEDVKKDTATEEKDTSKCDRLKKRIVLEEKSVEEFVSKVQSQIDKTKTSGLEIVTGQALHNSLREMEVKMETSLQSLHEDLLTSLPSTESQIEQDRQLEFVGRLRSTISQTILSISQKLKPRSTPAYTASSVERGSERVFCIKYLF